jgi:hypothetical protein
MTFDEYQKGQTATLFPAETPGATFSPCGRYRYTLDRRWGDGPLMTWVMLNPSTADAEKDDPTIRRCIAFAKAWGYGGLTVTNLFAFRATDPADMRAAADPVGPYNDRAILDACRGRVAVAAWGVHGEYKGRALAVCRMIDQESNGLRCLGVTKDGHPKHPLYVAGTTRPMVYARGTLGGSGDDR